MGSDWGSDGSDGNHGSWRLSACIRGEGVKGVGEGGEGGAGQATEDNDGRTAPGPGVVGGWGNGIATKRLGWARRGTSGGDPRPGAGIGQALGEKGGGSCWRGAGVEIAVSAEELGLTVRVGGSRRERSNGLMREGRRLE